MDLTLLVKMFTTYDIIVFRLVKDLNIFLSSFFLWALDMIIMFLLWAEQMQVQNNYAISIRNAKSIFWTIRIPSPFIPMDLIPIFSYLRSEHEFLRLNILQIIQ